MKIITKIFHSCLVLSLTYDLFAQVSIGGTPYSFGSNFKTQFTNPKPLKTKQLPVIDWQKIKEEDATTINSNRFAVAVPVNFDLKNSGEWFELANGDRLWQLKIQSDNALGLRVLFEKFWLPDKARLFMYDENQNQILGAFTSLNNSKTKRLGTDVINHHTIILEYYEPKAVKGLGELVIFRIDHAYRNLNQENRKGTQKNGAGEKGFGASGACNVNINCEMGNDWQDEKRGIAKIVLTNINGSDWCSGSLINNTAQDRKPYLLSANHCLDGSGQAFVDTWVFIFNYEAVSCTNPSADPSRTQSMSGATLLATYENSDFLLLELTEQIPVEYGVYFNGWDKTGVNHTSSVCIHHPSGDIKKIAIDTDVAQTSAYNGDGGSGTTNFRVVWNQNTTTEGGSSGSPLFNPDGQIVGQLEGGAASCSNLNGADWYGKLSVSWTGNGTPATRLLDWLDPTNSGVSSLDGLENISFANDVAVTIINSNEIPCNYSTNTPLQVTIRNNGTNNQSNIPYTYTLVRVADNSIISSGNGTINQLGTGLATTISVEVNLAITNTAYIFSFTTNLSNDENTSNNTKNTNYTTLFYVDKFPYKESFETSNGNWLSDGSNNEWEWGVPNGSVINQAADGLKIWATDLDGSYTNNTNAYLQSPIFNFSNIQFPYLSADIFVECEPDYDGLQLQISEDCGQTWQRLGNRGDGKNWYNNASNLLPFEDFGNEAWSGDAENAWKNIQFDLQDYAGKSNIVFRFLFKSDFELVREGIGIDDFRIFNDIFQNVISNDLDKNISVYPNPAENDFQILFNSKFDFGKRIQIIVANNLGQIIQNQTVESIPSFMEFSVKFLPQGLYFIQILTEKGNITKKIVRN